MDVTTVIINYQTPDLLEVSVGSFKKIYPNVPLLIADNGSEDHSRKVIERLVREHAETNSLFLEKNMYHGPAMDVILRNHISSDMVFFLDSDTETRKAGFLEEMTAIVSKEKVYAAGDIIRVNERGFKDEDGLKVISTPYMLIKKEYYEELPPFIHHGQPTIHNFREAHEKGLKLKEFPVSDYIFHHWRGTANRFGYGLGLKSKIDYLLNKIGL